MRHSAHFTVEASRAVPRHRPSYFESGRRSVLCSNHGLHGKNRRLNIALGSEFVDNSGPTSYVILGAPGLLHNGGLRPLEETHRMLKKVKLHELGKVPTGCTMPIVWKSEPLIL
jgi:hypothetical protein